MTESGFYATDNGELLVVFGGRILLDGMAYKDEDGNVVRELALSEGDKDYEIGEPIKEIDRKDMDEYHPLRFEFRDDRSIDALITQLLEIKNLGRK